MSYVIGSYVVCPGHGVGQLVAKEEQEYAGAKLTAYTIKILETDMTIMVPATKKDGIRPLVDASGVKEVYTLLGNHDVQIDTSTWNRRYRDYMEKLKTGSLMEIAEVLRELLLLKSAKKLSFGEKKMLEQCQDLVVSEISLTTGKNAQNVSRKITDIFPTPLA